MTNEQALDALIDALVQVEAANEALKAVKSEIKEAGLNAVILTAVAKAKIAGELQELADKSKTILEVIEDAA